MRRFGAIVMVCILCGVRPGHAGQAGGVVVGVNVYNEGFISRTAQDVEIARLAQTGVKIIRTSLGANTIYFITQAFQHGIGSVVIVYPFNGSKATLKGPWAEIPLSESHPQGFREWFQPLLDELETAGVRLTAIELGNEIDTSGYNGDLADPGGGRVLGISDLNNPYDPEAHVVAGGYRAYLEVMAALQVVRDHSKLNTATPILLAGLADWGLPSPTPWDRKVGVSVPDTSQFLRQYGMDKLVDGYGVHVYANGDPRRSISARISELEQKKIFAECGPGTKPCWLTEWGFGNPDQSCPLNDEKRMQAIEAERSAFKQFMGSVKSFV
ncbi:MAG TPA: hypothetical protein VKZ50_08370 [bacterium]|nr:hypothetical protein [bacterium]